MSAKADARWDGYKIVLLYISLAIFSVTTAGIAIAETTLTTNILGATALTLSLISIIHSLSDILLFRYSHLNPVYTVSLYSILFTFWLVLLAWEMVEVVYVNNGGYYDYYEGVFGCSIGDTQKYYPWSNGYDVKCPLPKSRFAVSWFIVGVYLILVIFAARVLRRDQKAKMVKLIDERILALGKGENAARNSEGGVDSVYEECIKESALLDEKAVQSHTRGEV
ncbi:hypothetical protein L873DRAFT_314978 [Choiromyces venosus 120613-1]|uniref:MARVEL domain-containing protein n=1 Tax=Choiromyces venosus 120613-1 TaxID=1336337 RepID=A0A3N4JC25_9PEZI|nr:hypothetical protein L873DRAFT_314978 [Choiromyces venosus 120613-1]